MPRISRLELDQVNRQIRRIDDLKQQLDDLQQRYKNTHQELQAIKNTHAPIQFNNLSFNWTGATGSLSWSAGSVVDKAGNNVPIVAGSLSGLTASTYYWLAWNPIHQQMIAQIGLDGVLQKPENVVICQVFTGTGGVSGVAGGGGSSSAGSDLTGGRYKLF